MNKNNTPLTNCLLMTDLRTLEEKHARNDEQRLEWIDLWAKFVANAKDDDKWGDQLNELINSQIEAARVSDCTQERSRKAEHMRGSEE